MKRLLMCAAFAALAISAGAMAAPPKNVIIFVGAGMGPSTVAAARIYRYKEDGALFFESLDYAARVRTYANDAQTTDGAAAISAYMTGAKGNVGVLAMSADTRALAPAVDRNGNAGLDNCGAGNGTPMQTLLETAKARGKAIGVVTTDELTGAAPAAALTHGCHRGATYAIAQQLAASGADVLLGGGRQHFTPYHKTRNRLGRADGADLLAKLRKRGYTLARDAGTLAAARGGKLFGAFAAGPLDYELDRTIASPQPTLAQMTLKAMEVLGARGQGYVLLVEGARIDHAMHATQAKRALTEVVALDDAVRVAVGKLRRADPALEQTLVLVTADHDTSLAFNGYPIRGNPLLDIVRHYKDGQPMLDADGKTFTTLGFGTGLNRPGARAMLDSATVLADGYSQEAGIRKPQGGHGGGDVMLQAAGNGAHAFRGTLDNIRVHALLKQTLGW
ncbi:MAG TPA: alkaline phosphatase [Burkholderiaceae bacterium]